MQQLGILVCDKLCEGLVAAGCAHVALARGGHGATQGFVNEQTAYGLREVVCRIRHTTSRSKRSWSGLSLATTGTPKARYSTTLVGEPESKSVPRGWGARPTSAARTYLHDSWVGSHPAQIVASPTPASPARVRNHFSCTSS